MITQTHDKMKDPTKANNSNKQESSGGRRPSSCSPSSSHLPFNKAWENHTMEMEERLRHLITEFRKVAPVVRRLVRISDKVAECHPQAVTSQEKCPCGRRDVDR